MTDLSCRERRSGGYGRTFDAVLIAVTANRQLTTILLKLHELGIPEAYLVPLYVLETEKDILSEELSETERIQHLDLSRPNLPHLETHVTDRCNLNCKACNNFAPFYTEDGVREDSFFSDLKHIGDRFDKICRLFLLGGEPLLEPDRLIRYLRYARELCPGTELRVITNGLLLSRTDERVFECMRETDALFQVSLYPVIAEKKADMEALFGQYGVKHIISARVDEFVKRLTPAPQSDPVRSERACGSSGCMFFMSGRISKCPDAILVEQFGREYGTSYRSGDAVDIDGGWDDFELLERLDRPIDMCRYCAEVEEPVPWEPVGGERREEDWVICGDYKQRYTELADRYHALRQSCTDIEARNSEVEARGLELEARNSALEERIRQVEARNSEVEERNRQVESYNTELIDLIQNKI